MRERLSFFFLATSVQAQEPGAVNNHTQQNREAGSIPTGGAALRLVNSTGAACQAHLPPSVGWRGGLGVSILVGFGLGSTVDGVSPLHVDGVQPPLGI